MSTVPSGNITSNHYDSIANATGGFSRIISEFDETYHHGHSDGRAIEAAFNVQMQRVNQLWHTATNGGRGAIGAQRLIQDYRRDPRLFLSPPSGYASEAAAAATVRQLIGPQIESAYNPSPYGASIDAFASEYVHTVTDFPKLTAANAQRRLITLYDKECNTNALDAVFYQRENRDICRKEGTISVVPVQAPSNGRCQRCIGECTCTLRYWRFGEVTRGGYSSDIYDDAFMWSWLLEQCDQYGGLAHFLPWISKISAQRKIAHGMSILFDATGPRADLFNIGNRNIIGQYNDATITDGNHVPLCLADAVFIVRNLGVVAPTLRDHDGVLMNCRTGYNIITGSPSLAKQFREALNDPRYLEETAVTRGTGANAKTVNVEISARADIDEINVVYEEEIRNIATDPHPNGGIYADWSYIITPVPAETELNPYERADLNNFSGPQLFQQAGNTQTMAGVARQDMGDFHTMQKAVKALNGYGGGALRPERSFGSNGTDMSV